LEVEGAPCLYLGVAEPLIEKAHVWLAQVPPFIEVGEVVRVNTEDGSCGGRAKG